MMNIFFTRSVPNQVQNNCKKPRDSPPCDSSKTNESSKVKLDRKVNCNERMCHTQNLCFCAVGQGHKD